MNKHIPFILVLALLSLFPSCKGQSKDAEKSETNIRLTKQKLWEALLKIVNSCTLGFLIRSIQLIQVQAGTKKVKNY